MQNCIFYNWLEKQGKNFVGGKGKIVRYPAGIIDPILKTQLLDCEVGRNIVKLLIQRGAGSPCVFQDITHCFPQKFGGGGSFPVAVIKRHHTDGFQRIINKMGIDLTGQQLIFHLLLLVDQRLFLELGFIYLYLLLLDIMDHHFKPMKGIRQLIIAFKGIDDIIISLAGMLHGSLQRGDTAAEVAGGIEDAEQGSSHGGGQYQKTDGSDFKQ